MLLVAIHHWLLNLLIGHQSDFRTFVHADTCRNNSYAQLVFHIRVKRSTDNHSRGISLLDAFGAANDVLKGAVQGIAELITRPGLMNVDFADVRTVMSEMGYAMMGSGVASGEDRAEEAAEMAISSPLLEDIDLSGARGVLVNITAGFDLRLDEFETVGNTIRAFASDNATVVIGTSLNPDE